MPGHFLPMRLDMNLLLIVLIALMIPALATYLPTPQRRGKAKSD